MFGLLSVPSVSHLRNHYLDQGHEDLLCFLSAYIYAYVFVMCVYIHICVGHMCMCVCTSTFVSTCVCVYTCMCVHAWGCVRCTHACMHVEDWCRCQESSLIAQCFCLLRQVSHGAWSVMIIANVASQLAPGAPRLCFLNACLTGGYYAHPALCGILESLLWSSRFKCFTWWAISQSWILCFNPVNDPDLLIGEPTLFTL